MLCEAAQTAIQEALRGAGTPMELARRLPLAVHRHLEFCAACRRAAHELLSLDNALGGLESLLAAPPDLAASVMARVRRGDAVVETDYSLRDADFGTREDAQAGGVPHQGTEARRPYHKGGGAEAGIQDLLPANIRRQAPAARHSLQVVARRAALWVASFVLLSAWWLPQANNALDGVTASWSRYVADDGDGWVGAAQATVAPYLLTVQQGAEQTMTAVSDWWTHAGGDFSGAYSMTVALVLLGALMLANWRWSERIAV